MSTQTQLDPQTLAERCAQSMWRDDLASQHLGMQIVSIKPGQATLSMTVKDTMVNGHKICHGGYLFTLADSCFAFSCNTYNQRTVAHNCNITYVAPAFEGDTLTATGKEISRQGRSGIYDITITNQDGQAIVFFRGLSRTIKGTLVDVDNTEPTN